MSTLDNSYYFHSKFIGYLARLDGVAGFKLPVARPSEPSSPVNLTLGRGADTMNGQVGTFKFVFLSHA